jgi:hypothetical protein
MEDLTSTADTNLRARWTLKASMVAAKLTKIEFKPKKSQLVILKN